MSIWTKGWVVDTWSFSMVCWLIIATSRRSDSQQVLEPLPPMQAKERIRFACGRLLVAVLYPCYNDPNELLRQRGPLSVALDRPWRIRIKNQEDLLRKNYEFALKEAEALGVSCT